MQKNSNCKYFTLISTVIKRLAAESLALKIKMPQLQRHGFRQKKFKCRKIVVKNLKMKILLEKSFGKMSDAKSLHKKNMQQNIRGQKKNYSKKSDC